MQEAKWKVREKMWEMLRKNGTDVKIHIYKPDIPKSRLEDAIVTDKYCCIK